MASLALGIAGAAIGGAIGGPLGAQIGWVLGAAVGNALDPQKGPAGPRLDDLKLHNSSYGGITPYMWGTMRVAGNIIEEQPEFTEHESGGDGGKGGPEPGPTYTYTCSFGVRLCEGPIKGILRIWANGRLIYDHNAGAALHDNLPMTIYLGTEEQLPDPTLESIHGAGNVPAYRGIAYCVFTDLPLEEFGRALPNLNFEVYTVAGEIPIRISTWNTTAQNGDGGVECAEWDAAAQVIHMGGYHTIGGVGGWYTEQDYTIMGEEVGSLTTISTPNTYGPRLCYITNKRWCAYSTNGGADAHWFVNGIEGALISAYPSPATQSGVWQEFASLNSAFVFTPSSAIAILAFACDDSGPGMLYASCDISAYCSNSGNIHLASGDNDCIYCFINEAGGTVLELSFDPDAPTTLIVSNTWDIGTDFPSCGGGQTYRGGSFLRYHDIWATNFASFSTFTMNLLDVSNPAAIALYPQARSDPNQTPDFTWHGGNITTLFGGYVIGQDGVALLDAPPEAVPLSLIVGELSERTGLAAPQYDVDELTDLVAGYLVNQQATTRDIIQPLRDGYFFDAVERDGAAVFVKRGHPPAIAIPDDELAAHADGEGVPPVIGLVRAQEVDLPCVVNVDYVSAVRDYQTSTQAARRQVTQSASEVSLNLPINLTDVKAKAVADVQLYTAWVERNRFTFFTSRKYAAYEPTDVVTVNGRNVRVLEKNETRPGVVKWDGVESLEQAMIQAGGAVTVEFVPSPPGGVTITTDTTAYLLDLPLVSDSDNPDGFYAAMTWDTGSGAGLYKSADGVTYAAVASTTVRATMGTATTTLGDFTGGNMLDQGNALEVVLLDDGELASTTRANLLNGANLAVVGDEVLQFQLAELVDVDTYRLTGLLRGRLGTEFAIATHGADEEFALLPTLRVAQDFSELYTSRSFKAVTNGQALTDADAQTFTNTGAAWRPYSPVLLGGGTDGAGDVELHWTRRTRLGGGAWLSVDVPLGESGEAYSVLIWNDDYTLCAREIPTFDAQSTIYTAADQVTDFGATQETIFFSVSQVGSAGFGTQARGLAPGAGASNVDPLAPITPPGA